MCEFCTQHGEGQKWYLSMKNYSRELYNQKNRREIILNFMNNFEEDNAKDIMPADGLRRYPFVLP